MKAPLRWLEDYVDVTLTPEELAAKLTFAGLEVEALEYVGLPQPQNPEKLGARVSGLAWDLEGVVVGEVLEVREHPDADRLVVATVDDGSGERTSVSGAPNLRPYLGKGRLQPPLKAAVAREGALLVDPKGPGPRRLEPGTIRGVASEVMLCSQRELGISDAHEGVILLDADAPAAGTPLVDVLGDVVFDIAITPNMARNASILGVAREIAALTGQPLRPPETVVQADGPPIADKIRIEIREPELNPRFTATYLEGVTIAPSPYWLQHRLTLAGMRPISNIVDATNYAMLEIGQPLHAFDYDELVRRAQAEGLEVPTLVTRLPEPGERLKTLDGVDRPLDEFTVLVTDARGALSMGGIMGGEESEVSDSTVNVLLEAAAWDFLNIRRSTLFQQLHSEAGYRFSRGVHPEQAIRGNLRCIELMRRLAGGTIARGVVDEHPLPAEVVVVELPFGEVERALGIEIPRPEVLRILEALELGVEDDGEILRVTVPDHRLDIGEGVIGIADLVEEISRIYGYERIPLTQIADTIPPQHANPSLEAEERVRDLLAGLGLQEVVTYRLTAPEKEARARVGAEADPRPWVTMKKSISEERSVMRHELLPSVLEIAEANSRHRDGLALFEIGQVYLPVEGETLPEEPRRLAVVLAGAQEPPSWTRAERRPSDFWDLKGLVDALAGELHRGEAVCEPDRHPSFHPGRCAKLSVEGRDLGIFGELHPAVREAYGFPYEAVLAADVDFEALQELLPDRHAAEPIPRFPPVVEDLAFIVEEKVSAAALHALIAETGGELLREVRLFDLYHGEQLRPGQKSLAYRLTYQSEERTLTDDEVATLRQGIVSAAESALGARLRG